MPPGAQGAARRPPVPPGGTTGLLMAKVRPDFWAFFSGFPHASTEKVLDLGVLLSEVSGIEGAGHRSQAAIN